ncbi:MFS transporter [Nonomuraea bangladeshensis]|uniref:MFS transporter n=1 Tax=Nonomuraea bangladeshensis TaxID=404385 RepID=UPI003C2CD485
MSASLFLVGIDVTVLHVALPSLIRDLRPSATAVLWIVDVYSLTVAALLVTSGTLGDRIGRKRMVLTGFAVFGVASAAASVSATTAQLIGARLLLGAGAAMIMASTVAIIRSVFPNRRERAVALGAWTAAHSAGAMLGPVLGGVLVERWGWGSVFLINLPVVLLVLAIGVRLIPESRSSTPRRWRPADAALSVAALGLTVYAVKQLGEHPSAWAAATGAVGLALVVIFVLRQRRISDPLLDLTLFADRQFTAATVCVLVCFGCSTSLLFFLTQRFQLVDGFTPVQAGLALLPLGAATAVGAGAAPWVAARWGHRTAVVAALAVFAAAVAVLPAALGGPVVPIVLIVIGTAVGVVETLGADLVMSAASEERAGEASAIQETAFELGAGVGIATLGTVLAIGYRVALPHSASEAGQSLGSAVKVAEALPPPQAANLLNAAGEAFQSGLIVTLTGAAVLLGLTAALALVLLREARRTSPVHLDVRPGSHTSPSFVLSDVCGRKEGHAARVQPVRDQVSRGRGGGGRDPRGDRAAARPRPPQR